MIKVVHGDITKQNVDIIVNAANRDLIPGGGCDGAIHSAAGPELFKECKKLNGCPTGEAKFTNGHNLNAKWIIHTVGPVWMGGKNKEDELLKSCYKKSLQLAENLKAETIAFPSISTGVYGFPTKRAASIAHETVKEHLKTSNIKEVIFVCYEKDDYLAHVRLD